MAMVGLVQHAQRIIIIWRIARLVYHMERNSKLMAKKTKKEVKRVQRSQ